MGDKISLWKVSTQNHGTNICFPKNETIMYGQKHTGYKNANTGGRKDLGYMKDYFVIYH